MEPITARQTWRTVEPIHGMIYFSPEATAAYESLGLTGRMGYFASRAAPMGAVPAEVVIATFFNFRPQLVRDAIPEAWNRATPAQIVDARVRAADLALRRSLPDAIGTPELAEAAELSLAARPRSRVITSTADPSSRVMHRSNGPPIRTSCSGTRKACSASSAATATSPRWSPPGSTAWRRRSPTSPPATFPAQSCWRRATGPRMNGRPESKACASAAFSNRATDSPSPRPVVRNASGSKTPPTPQPSSPTTLSATRGAGSPRAGPSLEAGPSSTAVSSAPFRATDPRPDVVCPSARCDAMSSGDRARPTGSARIRRRPDPGTASPIHVTPSSVGPPRPTSAGVRPTH